VHKRAVLIERAVPAAWRAGVDAFASTLSAMPGWILDRRDALSGGGDLFVICAESAEECERVLASGSPADWAKTILIGVNLPWQMGALAHEPRSLPHLLETYSLGGACPATALTAWREAPSSFAGPKLMMEKEAVRTNCMKAMQSAHYCVWARARGGSLAEFLVAYASAL
jgi:hypothetical protein